MRLFNKKESLILKSCDVLEVNSNNQIFMVVEPSVPFNLNDKNWVNVAGR